MRRMKGRPINGSAELFLGKDHPLQDKLIAILDDIEDAELQIAELSESATGKVSIEESRRNRLLTNEMKLRINRLTEEYEEIVKVLPLSE